MNRGTTEAVCIECTLHTTLLWLSWHLVLRPIYCGHRWHSEWLRRMLDGFCDDAVPMAADSTNCGWLTWIYFLFGRSCDAYAANKITFSVLLLLEIMMLFLAIEVTIALRTSVFIYKSWRSYYKKNPAISIFSQFDLIISPLMRLVLRQFPSICFAGARAHTTKVITVCAASKSSGPNSAVTNNHCSKHITTATTIGLCKSKCWTQESKFFFSPVSAYSATYNKIHNKISLR